MKYHFALYISILSLTISSAQKPHAPIPVAMNFDYFGNSTALSTLENLSWTNPDWLSDEQYAAGIINPIATNGPSEAKFTFPDLDFKRVKPFLAASKNVKYATLIEKLYQWFVKNKLKLENDNYYEDAEFISIASEITELNPVFKEYLNAWMAKQTFLVLPNGKPLPKNRPFELKYINPLLNLEEHFIIKEEEIEAKKQIVTFPFNANSKLSYKVGNDKQYVFQSFDAFKNLISSGSSYKCPFGTCIDSYYKGKLYYKELGNRYQFYHENGKLSFETIGHINTDNVTFAYDPDGKISYENGNGNIYWYTGEYREYDFDYFIVTVQDGKEVKRTYMSNNGKILEEVTIANDGDDIEYGTYYSFKSGNVTHSNINGDQRVHSENLLTSKDYIISVSALALHHGITSYKSLYPIGSSLYKAPKLLNPDEVKNTIIANIDSFLDFKSQNINHTNYISIAISYKDFKGQEPQNSKIIKEVAKIDLGAYDGKKLNSWHDLVIKITLE